MARACSPLAGLVASVYVSEGHDLKLIEKLATVASSVRGTKLLRTFIDEPYGRTGFTISGVGYTAKALSQGDAEETQQHLQGQQLTSLWDSRMGLAPAVTELVKESLQSIDLSDHVANHPRLGVIDHIAFHPLGACSMEAAKLAAHWVGSKLQSEYGDISIYMYGAASREGYSLAGIRRALGYFRGERKGTWEGLAAETKSTNKQACLSDNGDILKVSYGPSEASDRDGAIVIGAVPWVVNYNVPLQTDDLAVARKIARAVSERRGGLPGVEAMALPHGTEEIEVACNLRDISRTSTSTLEKEIQRLSIAEGVSFGPGYVTGVDPDQALLSIQGLN